MKKFLFKLSFYISGILLLFVFLGSYADGNTDDNYMHFAVSKPKNIILGDSRGAQAVVPDVLHEKLRKEFDNFSLNIVQSPYGEVYFRALKRKLDPDTKNGIFILTVDPWNLSLNKDIHDLKDFPENNSPLNNMYFYDWSPNYEYLLKNYTRSWFKIYTDRAELGRSTTYLHKNGWMEVTVNMQKDSVQRRESEKLNFYKKNALQQRISQKRMDALEKIINYLKGKGDIYLVRIPASQKMMEIEDSYSGDFSEKMRNLSQKHKINFFDFSSAANDYTYTDGNHMYKDSGKRFTGQIADSILIHTEKLK